MKTIVIIEGAVGSGKSTLFTSLRESYKNDERIGFVDEPSFTSCPLMGRNYNPLDEIYKRECGENIVCSQLHITRTLADHYAEQIQDKAILIFDRWIWSCRHFIMMRQGSISAFAKNFLLADVTEKHSNFIESLGSDIQIHLLFLDTSPEECFQRLTKRNRQEEITCGRDFWIDLNSKFRHEALDSKETYIVCKTSDDMHNEIDNIVQGLTI